MTQHHPDLDDDDYALVPMAHGELVALLNRLYDRMDEKPIAASTADASTAEDLRDRIRVVRRRLADRLGVPAPLLPAVPRRGRNVEMDLDAEDRTRPPARVFVVLFANDRSLTSSARVACRSRGITLVSIPSIEMFAALVASVTPTHIVIVAEGFERGDVAASTILARDLEQRGVRMNVCRDADEAMCLLAEIRP